MKSEWIIYTNAKNEKNATVLFHRFAKQLGGEIEGFQCVAHGGSGFNVNWRMLHKTTSWSELLMEVLQLAQKVGNGWLLTGDVVRQCNAWCNRPRVAGVQTIEWAIKNSDTR
ncbi:MAG: hypothetical protein AMJ53_10425 [Gammaproteobacteria bacterium SG8_11]|nr:MAG: hypothetical protein AMJ53_10425 [Gammaproteobacteria bacterium SG8_11]